MLKFEPYPITINGSKKDDEIRAKFRAKFEKGEIDELKMLEEIRLAKPNQWDYVADTSPAAIHYEGRVKALLSYIRANKLGHCLLEMLRIGGTQPIWIIPYDSDQIENQGDGNANVTWAPGEYIGGNTAVRLCYSFEMFTYDSFGKLPGARADEVLFHEMVHAYRYANPSVKRKQDVTLPGYADHEEFLAHQLANVYRSMGGAKKFNLDYTTKKIASAAECEAALKSSKPLLDALDLFLSSDPLTKRVAKMTTLYNLSLIHI